MAALGEDAMPLPILIAYVTRGGSTAEVAEAIATSLRAEGLTADVLPMSRLDSLEGRTTLILGAPLYIGRLPDEFHKFVERHHQALAALRPWCFVLGPTRVLPGDFEAARNQAKKQLDRYPWLLPAEVQIFGGRYDMKHLPFPFSIVRHIPLFPANKIPGSDIRDWVAIRKWAIAIAHQLKPAA
jgi:menaquinone-dependent protoporphyrinogen oxidase